MVLVDVADPVFVCEGVVVDVGCWLSETVAVAELELVCVGVAVGVSPLDTVCEGVWLREANCDPDNDGLVDCDCVTVKVTLAV